MNVNDMNEDPIATDDVETILEDSGAQILDVLSNDTDQDNDHLRITDAVLSDPALGTVSVTTDGRSIEFTPAPDTHGSTTIVYTVSDGDGAADQGTMTLTVDPVNDRPLITRGTNVTLDPVMYDSYMATDDVEVRYAFAPLDSAANNKIWNDAAMALGWRYAVENLGIEARRYDDADEQAWVSVNWTDSEGQNFEIWRHEAENWGGNINPGSKQGPVWNSEYADVMDTKLPLTRDWYESSEEFGQVQIGQVGLDPQNPFSTTTYKPTWEELEAEATKIYEAFTLTDDTITLSSTEGNRDGLDVSVDDAALAEVFVNPYQFSGYLDLALLPEHTGLQRTSELYVQDQITFEDQFFPATEYSYLNYSSQKSFSTVDELALYGTRIFLTEVRETEGSLVVDENIDTSVVIHNASATDADSDDLTYSLAPEDLSEFNIDSVTGEVRFNESPDFESQASYDFTVTASDGELSDEQLVSVQIRDVFEVVDPVIS